MSPFLVLSINGFFWLAVIMLKPIVSIIHWMKCWNLYANIFKKIYLSTKKSTFPSLPQLQSIIFVTCPHGCSLYVLLFFLRLLNIQVLIFSIFKFFLSKLHGLPFDVWKQPAVLQNNFLFYPLMIYNFSDDYKTW